MLRTRQNLYSIGANAKMRNISFPRVYEVTKS